MFPRSNIRIRGSGKLATTGYANEIAETLRRLQPHVPTGQTEGILGSAWLFLAEIWDSGPNGEADYTSNDGLYWAIISYVNPGQVRDPIVLATASSDADVATVDNIITVNNLVEQRVGATPRSLNKGDPVLVYGVIDAAGVLRYVTFAEAGVGQYQFMVKQVVAQNQAGWDNVRAHSME